MRITVFEVSPSGFHLVAEAPSADVAIEFGERIRKELNAFQYKPPSPPTPIDDTHWRFEIFGKR